MPNSVVIVGGGVGGLFTANKLTSKLASEVRRGEVLITLVEPQEKQVYQPGFVYVPSSELSPEVMFRPTQTSKKLASRRLSTSPTCLGYTPR
jgi:sulfide:quinone oxidoreductase